MAKKILLVDDDPLIQELYKTMLLAAGYEVTAANNGQECLSIVDKFKPDVIIMDMMMPSMGGIETARRLGLNVATASIPILFATNSIAEGQEKLGGQRPFLSKCGDPKEFLAKVKAFVENPKTAFKPKPIMDFNFGL